MKSFLFFNKRTVVSALSLLLLTISCGSSNKSSSDFSSNEVILSRTLLDDTNNNTYYGQTTLLQPKNGTVESVRIPKDTFINNSNVDEVFAQGTPIQSVTHSILEDSDTDSNTNNNNVYAQEMIPGSQQVRPGFQNQNLLRGQKAFGPARIDNELNRHIPTRNPNQFVQQRGVISNPNPVIGINPYVRRSSSNNFNNNHYYREEWTQVNSRNNQFSSVAPVPVFPTNYAYVNGNTQVDNDTSFTSYEELIYSGTDTCSIENGCFWFDQVINSSYSNYSGFSSVDQFNEYFWTRTAFSYRSEGCSSVECTLLAIPTNYYSSSSNYSYAVYSVQ